MNVPAHLKTKVITQSFLSYLRSGGLYESFRHAYQVAKETHNNHLVAIDAAIKVMIGNVSFVWFGTEQIPIYKLDKHLLLEELRKQP